MVGISIKRLQVLRHHASVFLNRIAKEFFRMNAEKTFVYASTVQSRQRACIPAFVNVVAGADVMIQGATRFQLRHIVRNVPTGFGDGINENDGFAAVQ